MLDLGEGGLAAAGHLRDPLQRRGILAIESALAAHGLDIRAGHEVAIDGARQQHDAGCIVVFNPVQRLD